MPILMLTARGEPIDRIVGLELGADDYLPKPFEPRELLARLRAVLRRRTGAAVAETPVLRFGNLELRHDHRQVQIDSQPRTLTGYQFDLLWVLAQNAGRVMSREALMDRLKGQSLEAFDRSIDVHISRIGDRRRSQASQTRNYNPRHRLYVRAAHGHGTLIEATVDPLDGGGARLLVEDQGPGVPEEERERIFDPFYRPARMREGADRGVGLGLALVRQIARHHHGEAFCLKRVGGGTRLEITLAACRT